jgi:glycosyltransferase involved in cell wall biosynthesis
MCTVTVIVPVCNEGPELGASLVCLADYLEMHSSYKFSYVIVDDGSTDESHAIAAKFARYHRNVTLVTHERNYGLGSAVRSAIPHAEGEYTIVMDADLSYGPPVAMALLETAERENADVVLASPYMRGGRVENVPFTRRVLSREANRILSLATKGRYATLTCMVRAYRTSLLKSLPSHFDGMESSAELLLGALRMHARVVEIPAKLAWSEERRLSRGSVRIASSTRRIWNTLRLAFAHRPALWLIVPGLFPGLLPLVAGTLWLLHAEPSTIVIWSAATIAVQYTSIAIFAGQLATFFTRVFSQPRDAATQRVMHL